MSVEREIGAAIGAIASEREEDRYRAQYRAAMRVLRGIPSGTRDADLSDEQREAWRLHDEALKWFETATPKEGS